MNEISYVGVNNVARKIADVYIGVNNVARKVAYAYVGVNGIARKIYSSIKIKPFTSNIFPTNWQNVESDNTKATSSNIYGTWSIEGVTILYTSNIVDAFDNSELTWLTSSMSTNIMSVYIYLPENVFINPSKLKLVYRNIPRESSNKIKAFNDETGLWEDLGNLTGTGSTKYTEIFSVNTDKYYSKFCVDVKASTATGRDVYEFQITNGNIKYKG